jgi:hypothetical protein
MAIPYSKLMLIQRIRKYIANGYPNDDFSTSENEILLQIDQELAFNLVGQVYANAKVEGNLAVPDAYLTTYSLPALTQDTISQTWYTTLPQPPISLPLGYSLDRCYFADSVNGVGIEVALIKPKRVAYRKNMPMPLGVLGWVEGSKLNLMASDGSSLLNKTCYVRMATTRTTDVNATMTLPDDAIEAIFNSVVAQLTKRYNEPKDVVKDNIGAGNKSS